MSETHDSDADARETLELRGRHPASPSGALDGGSGAAGPVASSTGEGPGSVVDRYLLIEEIGEGGFGSVYRAAQSDWPEPGSGERLEPATALT